MIQQGADFSDLVFFSVPASEVEMCVFPHPDANNPDNFLQASSIVCFTGTVCPYLPEVIRHHLFPTVNSGGRCSMPVKNKSAFPAGKI